MKELLSYVLLAALGVHLGAHVAIAAGLVRERSFLRAALAFFVPPLAPWWAWARGMRVRTYVWGASLAVYALGVALA